jgi:hypothetical protein
VFPGVKAHSLPDLARSPRSITAPTTLGIAMPATKAVYACAALLNDRIAPRVSMQSAVSSSQ